MSSEKNLITCCGSGFGPFPPGGDLAIFAPVRPAFQNLLDGAGWKPFKLFGSDSGLNSVVIYLPFTPAMSSTYAHYQGPASLPSDYAILSRFSSVNEDFEPTDELREGIPSGTDPRPVRRRESLPVSPYFRPRNPTVPVVGVYPQGDSKASTPPTENTPLLSPPVPRIEEEIDRNVSADNGTSMAMFWEELRILTKYALPVFGYVHFFIF
jgi:hypothetical protein